MKSRAVRATFFADACELRLHRHFRPTPNAIATTYDENDVGIWPETDVQLRLTLFVGVE